MKRKSKPTKKKPLTEAKLQRIISKLPGGISGFMKGWGWLTFTRKIEAAHGIK